MSIDEIMVRMAVIAGQEQAVEMWENNKLRKERAKKNILAIRAACALLRTHPEAVKGAPNGGEAAVGERKQSGESEPSGLQGGERCGASADDEPLTRKQLQFMSGDPVWIVREDGADRWALIRYANSGGINTYGCGFLAWEDLGKIWFPYLRPPKEDHLRRLPAADVEPVRYGTWEVLETYRDGGTAQRCSQCRGLIFFHRTNPKTYCPNCGAKMDGKDVMT